MSGTSPNNDANLWGRIARLISNAQRLAEGVPIMQRAGLYGEMTAEVLSIKQHKLADEGSYYVCRSPTIGTGIATLAAPTAYADGSPYIIVSNNNPSPSGKTIYLDYIKLICTAAGTNGTNLWFATRIDSIMRYSSGGAGGNGTGLTAILAGPYPTNTMAPANSSALIYAGALVAIAGSAQAKTLVNGPLRTAIPVVNDQYFFNFGECDMALDGVLVSGTNVAQRTIPHPPVAIAPQHSFPLHLWLASQSVASSYEVEIGYLER